MTSAVSMTRRTKVDELSGKKDLIQRSVVYAQIDLLQEKVFICRERNFPGERAKLLIFPFFRFSHPLSQHSEAKGLQIEFFFTRDRELSQSSEPALWPISSRLELETE